ncbi:hypothetical protein HYT56_02290 [Candidatus Woesearchaeota archaeon]|nr:hypothetical protein [Candidatus Woesearchaeota archaeon]
MNFNPEEASFLRDNLNKFTVGYYTSGLQASVMDSDETTLAVLLLPINVGMDSNFYRDDGIAYWENPRGSTYIKLTKIGGTLKHIDSEDANKKRIEVQFIYVDS